MGIVSVPKFTVPPLWLESSESPVTLDAADKRAACVFAITKSGTLDKFEFLTGNTVSVNAASVIRVSFRVVVSATGEPSGVAAQYRDILGSALSGNAWISPGLMTSDGTDGGAKRVVIRGDLVVVVIEYQSFTAADDIDLAAVGGRSTDARSGGSDGFPYDLFQSSGSWDKFPNSERIVFALKYDDGSYGRPLVPGLIGASTSISSNPFYSSASAPDERGNRFTLPVPMRVTGALVNVAVGAGETYEVVLIDTDGTTELEAVLIDGDQGINTSGDPRFVPFATQHELAIGTYRLTIRPVTGNVGTRNIVVDSAAGLESVFNQLWYGTSRENLGAWTDETTRFYLLGLVIDGLEEGSGAAGGGGGVVLSDRSFVRGMIS